MRSLQYPNPGSPCLSLHADIRGTYSVRVLGVSRRSNEHEATSFPTGLASDLDRLGRVQNCRTLDCFVWVIINDFPELHGAICERVEERLAAPVLIHYTHKSRKPKVVPRAALMEASKSFATLQEFLKRQFDIPSEQQVKVRFSKDGEPGRAGEVELTEHDASELLLAALVGFANGWFVADA